MMKAITEEKPFVYSCSGCSSTAQMANYLAVQLDRRGMAEMSCIAGVGGNVKRMVRTARSGRRIITIDGCPLACAKACLCNHKIVPDIHLELTSFGVSKRNHEDFDIDEANLLLKKVEALISEKNTKISLWDLHVHETILNKDFILKADKLSENYSGIIIKEVVDKKQLRAFIDFPYRLYRGNKYYVPQLKRDIEDTFNKRVNPAFDFCEAKYWLAYKGDKVVGRIAGIINYAFIEKWGKKYIRFGWMDFEEDEEITKALLMQVEMWGREKGMTAVHGPLGFTNFDYAGLLIEGFDQLGTFATIYNYPYYPLFIERAGYKREVDWVEYKIKLPEVMPEKLEKIAAIVQKRYQLNVVEGATTKEIISYAKDIFRLVNSAYADLYGMVPLTDKQVEYSIRKYLSFIRADFVSLVLDKDSALAAFGITMPSLSAALKKAKGNLYPFGFIHLLNAFKKNNLADLCLVAVRKDLQGKGVNALLMHQLTRSYIKNGVEYAESNPELELNTKVQAIWEYYDAEKHKRRRCYVKYLQPLNYEKSKL